MLIVFMVMLALIGITIVAMVCGYIASSPHNLTFREGITEIAKYLKN